MTEMITIPRTKYEALLERLEDAEDIQAVKAFEARVAAVGWKEATKNFLPAELVWRMLDGEHPIRIWREHRDLTATTLARHAGIPQSYLSDIENRKKPGSIDTYRKLAAALEVTVDDILPHDDPVNDFRDSLTSDDKERFDKLLNWVRDLGKRHGGALSESVKKYRKQPLGYDNVATIVFADEGPSGRAKANSWKARIPLKGPLSITLPLDELAATASGVITRGKDKNFRPNDLDDFLANPRKYTTLA